MTIKAIGKQWYWTYEYPDNGNFTFDALMLSDRVAAQQGEPRLLGTDNHVVVPVNKTVRIITTGADVIHAWTIPAFGVKIDAVPGQASTRPGSTPTAKACSTASAPSCAARAMPSCRSRSKS